MVDVSLGLAFVAGLLSFISPCVLPLVPAYIGYMGGRMTRTVALQSATGTKVKTDADLTARANMLLHGLSFVAGFTLVFVLIGLATTAFVSVLGNATTLITDIIGRLGGVIIILFGLHFMGVMPRLFAWLRARPALLSSPLLSLFILGVGILLLAWGFIEITLALPAIAGFSLWLVLGGAFSANTSFWSQLLDKLDTVFYSDTRREMQAKDGKQGLGGSFLMGIVFSAGWTPCIGPIYGAVLTLAANTGDVGRALPLLTAYSLGLGVPFTLTALLLERAQGILRRLQRHMHTIELVSGGLLVLIGILVASGQLARLSQSLGNTFADLSFRVEECGVGFFTGEVAFNQVGACVGGTLLPVMLNQSAAGTLSDANTRLEYVFHVESALSVDVEIRNASTDFAPTVTLLSPTGQTVASISAPELIEGKGLALTGIELTETGQYTLTVQQDSAMPNSFRIKVIGEDGT